MSQVDGLTQNELDRLLAQFAEEAGHGRTRPFKFDHGGRIARQHLQILELVHGAYAQVTGVQLSYLVQERVHMEVASASVIDMGDFVESLPSPGIVGQFRLVPLPGDCLVEMSPDLGYTLLERFFGGRGTYHVPRRSLTDVEVAVMGRFLQRALAGLQEAWAKVSRVEPKLLAVETNPMLLKAGLAGEQTVRIIVRVQVDELRGHLQLAYPLPMLEPILDRLSQRTWFGQNGRSGNTVSAQMVSALDDVEVTVAAVLGRVPVTCRDLLSLAPGCVLRLDHAPGAPVELLVEGRRRYLGRPCRVGQRLAVQVQASIPVEQSCNDVSGG